jgi:pimeloyl-ACP methyl ester carboxylesterase
VLFYVRIVPVYYEKIQEDNMFNNDSTTTRREFVKRAGAAVAGATLFLGQSTLSTHAASFQDARQHHSSGAGLNILLVPGAFVDASSWSRVIPLLQDEGFNVLAVQNPNTSLEDDIAVTNQALASLSGPTLLVGHSYGGVVITNVGLTASHVTGLVYIAAFAPDVGESALSISTQYPAPAGQHLVPSYRSGFIWLDPPDFPQLFIQDVSLAKGRALAAVQKPLAPECFGAPSGSPNWKTLPSWFLISAQDRVISPDAERFMAKRMGATTRQIDYSHASPVSHPEDVFELILEAAQGSQQ